LDAIRQAEALRPDVVVLDISLPLLSGIDAAVRIQAKVPDAKLMFVTNECSLEVVDQAFRRGAHGYVYKPRAQRDVLPVFDAIVRGGRFISGGLERIARGDTLASHRHHVLFCSSDAILVAALSRFIAGALDDQGNAVIVVVTEAHEQILHRALQASQVDAALAIRQKRYIPVNITGLLAKVVVGGYTDPTRFLYAAENLISEAARRAGRHGRVAACGEGAATIWAQGHVDAAIQFEHLWDGIAIRDQVDVLCTYPMAAREESVRAVRRLCAEHTAVGIS
jgi:CheY-like chemotaxis protein